MYLQKQKERGASLSLVQIYDQFVARKNRF